MRICIVGCGAIGSLFAAHLGRLDDVEVWAFDPYQAHVDAINANGLRLTGKSDFVARVNARSNAAEIPPCEFGIIASKSLHTRAAMEATAACVRRRRRVLGAERCRKRGDHRRVRAAGDSRHDLPRRPHHGPRRRATRIPGADTWIGPFAPRPASMAEVTRLADACTRAGMDVDRDGGCARRAVDQADLQFRLQRDGRADAPAARGGLRPAGRARP